jgi:hypothetical protein
MQRRLRFLKTAPPHGAVVQPQLFEIAPLAGWPNRIPVT